MEYLFYRFDFNAGNQLKNISIDNKYSKVLWKPSFLKIFPAGFNWIPFAVWWAMHNFHIFSNEDYGLYLVFDGDSLIHRSVITPRYFRFPFMGKEDLQIGDTWTMSEHRGKGLAGYAVQNIVKSLKKSGRKFWYVVDENNGPSIRAIEKTGFEKYAMGVRTKRMNMRAIGTYKITSLP